MVVHMAADANSSDLVGPGFGSGGRVRQIGWASPGSRAATRADSSTLGDYSLLREPASTKVPAVVVNGETRGTFRAKGVTEALPYLAVTARVFTKSSTFPSFAARSSGTRSRTNCTASLLNEGKVLDFVKTRA